MLIQIIQSFAYAVLSKKFEIESPFLFGCNFGAAGIEVLDLLDWMDENRLIFEYMDTLDTMYSKDGKFYIAKYKHINSERCPTEFYGPKPIGNLSKLS